MATSDPISPHADLTPAFPFRLKPSPDGDLIRRAAGVLAIKPEGVVAASLDGLQRQ